METILCAVDFSPFTIRLIRTGAGLARHFGARLIVFHTVNFPVDTLFGSDRPERDIKAKRLMDEARQRIAVLAEDLDVAWEPVLVAGDPVEALEEVVRSRTVDLVVTASRGIGGVERLFLGTVVERMVMKVARPILILRLPHGDTALNGESRFERILVGCDLRSPCDPALDLARRLARGIDAELHLLHVIEAFPEDEGNDPYNESQQVLQARTKQRLDRACPDREPGEKIFSSVYPGVPAEALRRCARELCCDLIVAGVHRAAALKGALIGTTARQLLRKSPCSLLTVPEFAPDAGCNP